MKRIKFLLNNFSKAIYKKYGDISDVLYSNIKKIENKAPDMMDPTVTLHDKLLDIDNIVKPLFYVLLSRYKEINLKDLFISFTDLVNSENGIKILKITTSDSNIDSILSGKMESYLNAPVIVNKKLDKSIISGFIIEYDNYILDCSLKNELKRLSEMEV
jgi:F0F1-type ATP synthase delta subunit